MPDKNKQDYYLKNKKKRLEYQRKYYLKNAERIKRNRALKKENDPTWATEQRDYNRRYYSENKKKIRAKRADTKIKRLLHKSN